MNDDIVIDMCNIKQPLHPDFKWIGFYPDRRFGLCFNILKLMYKDVLHLRVDVIYPPTFKGINYKCYTVYVNDGYNNRPRIYHRTLVEALNEANLYIDNNVSN